jgi:hypothetical protein
MGKRRADGVERTRNGKLQVKSREIATLREDSHAINAASNLRC